MTRSGFLRHTLIATATLCTVALTALAGGAARAADEAPPVAAEAREAVMRMGKTLSAEAFSFHNGTIREYAGANGEPLHIFHAADVTVRRPDRFLVDVAGDDGVVRMAFDGKDLTVYSAATNKYATLSAPGSIEDMLRLASSKIGVDFPLADLLAESPAQAVLSDVTTGYMVNTVPIGGVPCRHLFLTQPPGLELELWLEDNEKALPRRLIVTYRSLPGEPRLIAEMFGWRLGTRPSDAEFTFLMPDGATKMEIGQERAK
ncbi:MAG: DUF2092 domain-containing protein [Rhodopila sp.]